MSPDSLLTTLAARGIRVWADAGRLELEDTRGSLTDADIELLRRRKSELLALLAAPLCADCGQPLQSDAAPGWRHEWCQGGCVDRWEATGGRTLVESGAPLPGERLSLFQACYRDEETDEEGRYALDERAAVYEFDAGLSRAEAEQRAAHEWLERAAPASEWLN